MVLFNRIDKFFGHTVGVVALLVGIFHVINVSGLIIFSDMTIRAIHLMAMMVIIFMRKPKKSKSGEARTSLVDVGIRFASTLLAIYVGLYILFRWKEITSSGGLTNNTDIVVGILAVLLILEATRRSVGWMLSLIALLFLSYPFIGKYLPSILNAREYSLERVFSFLYTSTEGVYGIPISVSATYIILFCIYGAFLNEFGAGAFFLNLSTSLTRKLNAAAAKTAIIFSALIGTISGSAAGNVAITGTFTIPLMKKEGYKPSTAGAIEACASTGGQFMPPIMGAAAFIMAEITATPYSSIMKAALLPSLLFFLSLFIIVDLTARKGGINQAKSGQEYKSFIRVFKEGWHFVVPIVTLIFMLANGYSPFKAAYYSSITLVVVYIIANRKLDLEILKKIVNALKKGAADTASIAIACAASGIIVGILSVTGLGSKLSNLVILLANGQLLLALFITMIVAIILGMGLPTTAAYLVLASVVAPALANMGLPLLTAHMFVFFFGCISTITPPVALASYVAAGIAGTDLNKVGWTAFRFGLVSFILPFMFVYSPALLLNGSILNIILTVVMSIIGIFAFSTSIVGYFKVNLFMYQRILLFISAILLMNEEIISAIIGLLLISMVMFKLIFKKVEDKGVTI